MSVLILLFSAQYIDEPLETLARGQTSDPLCTESVGKPPTTSGPRMSTSRLWADVGCSKNYGAYTVLNSEAFVQGKNRTARSQIARWRQWSEFSFYAIYSVTTPMVLNPQSYYFGVTRQRAYNVASNDNILTFIYEQPTAIAHLRNYLAKQSKCELSTE